MAEAAGVEAALPATTPRAIHPWVAEQARRIRFGIGTGPTASWSDLRAWVQTIERLGFDSFWLGDHPMGAADCWTTLAAVAVHTERLRLGPLVSCVYYRSAGLLARQAADVDRLSGGRLVLGLGAGDIPHEFAQLGLAYPPFRERATALAETVALVRGLWAADGAPVTQAGAFVRAAQARLATRPVQTPHVPLLIAGGGERITLRQVAEHADACNFGPNGATGSAWDLPDVQRKLAALDAHCAAVGRPPAAVLRSHIAWAVLRETDAAVEAALAARSNRADMVEAPREPGLPRRLTAYYRSPSLEHVANVTVAGTPPQFVAYYRALIAAGLRYFVVCPSGDPETVRLVAEAVVPHLAVPA
jgi:alkanesulfonate monooxygenase SsuD/methylene tetrahydromethanopterin reductase-like flavin-dependent oxidoreductase (luciferase family)